MGRPRKIAVPQEAAPKEEPKEESKPTVSKAEAVRQAFVQGLDELDDIEGFIKSHYGIEMPRQQLSAYKAQAKAKVRKTEGETPKRGRKPKAAIEGYLAPPKIEAKGDGDLLEALKSLKGLVNTHGADKVKQMVDLLG